MEDTEGCLTKCFPEETLLSVFLERGPAKQRHVQGAWLGLCSRLLGHPRAAVHLLKDQQITVNTLSTTQNEA